jgi:NAD(P)H-nitrite reductase large subunit
MDEDKIIICRCEDITLGKLREVLNAGVTDLEEVKRLLRCGMGLCQGRTCIPMVIREIANHRHIDIWEVGIPSVRQPILPVKIGSILEGIHEE